MRERRAAGASTASSPTRPAARPTTPRSCARPRASSSGCGFVGRAQVARRASGGRTTSTPCRPFSSSCASGSRSSRSSPPGSGAARGSSTAPAGIRNTDRERTIALFAEARRRASRRASSSRPPRAGAGVSGPLLGQARRRARDRSGRRLLPGDAAALAASLARLAARGIAPRRRPGPRAGRPDQVLRRRRVDERRAAGRPGSSGSTTATRRSRTTRSTPTPWPTATTRAAAALGLEVYGGDAIVSADGAHLRHRPERLAELRALPPRGRGADRRAARRAVHPGWESPDDRNDRQAPRGRRRARSAIVELEAAAHGAGPPVLRALLRPRDGARPGQPDLRRGRQRATSTSSPASPSAASATATRTTSRRCRSRPRRLTFGSFTTEVRAKFLDLLASVTPPGLTRIQLFSGGAEAVEAAFRLAKSVTKKFEFVGYSGAFHGKTGGVLPLLWGDFKDGLGPFVPGTLLGAVRLLLPLPAQPRPTRTAASPAPRRRATSSGTRPAGDVAAIIVEPMQGTAGNVIPPPGFLPAVQAIAKENGALFIADEMITGFGRTGKFWGVDHDGVVPDVMTVRQGHRRRLPARGRGLDRRARRRRSPSRTRRAARPPTAAIRSPRPRAWRRSRSSSSENLVENSARVGARCSRACRRCRRSTASSATCAARGSCSASSS